MTRSLGMIHDPAQAASALQRTRRLLLASLVEPDSAAGLARRLGLPRQRLNYHLRQLEREGLVELVAERRKGNCVERVVRATARSFLISPEALGEIAATPAEGRDRLSAAYLLQSTARTLREVATLDEQARVAGKRLATLTLESEVRFASAARRAAFAEELAVALGELVARYHDETVRGGRSFRLLATIHPVPAASGASASGGSELSAAGGDDQEDVQ